MSKCVECGREMAPIEAMESLECGPCRSASKRYAEKIRTINRRGAEFVGRKVMSKDWLSTARDWTDDEGESEE